MGAGPDPETVIMPPKGYGIVISFRRGTQILIKTESPGRDHGAFWHEIINESMNKICVTCFFIPGGTKK